jgi:uncharacterized protein
MIIGRLAALRRYPIKSLRGEALNSIKVTESGIPGDRSGALFVRSGHARSGKTYRGKEHERLHLTADVSAAVTMAMERGIDVEHRRGEHFFDDAPISLLVDRWLETLSAHLGYAVEWERFRPNFFVHAVDAFEQDEKVLEGVVLQLGEARLRVRCPIERCVAITYDPQRAATDPRILRFLAQQRSAIMGIYCDVLEPGVVRSGDVLEAPCDGGASAPHL